MVTIRRRTVLAAMRLGAVGAATSLAGCSRSSPSPPGPSTVPATTTTTTAQPVPPDWAALRAKLPGGLVLPEDPGYDVARRSYNPLFDTRRPAAVATCTRAEDVQACVEVARKARMPIAARSGGHSYAGYSTPADGLVVDVRRMSGVSVSGDRATIGAGTRLIDVYAGLAAAGRSLPAGSCPTVGIAGLALGGGFGVMSRKFGLTADHLIAAEIVTADSRKLIVSAESEPDLFWALRGGGGGNLGIVTSFTFVTDPAPEVAVFALRFPAGSAPAVVGAWQEWVAAAPDELFSNCVLSGGSPPSCRVGGCFVGPATTLNPLLDSLQAKAGRATSRFVQARAYLDAMRYFAGCSQRTVPQCHPDTEGGQLGRQGFVASSRMLPGPVDPARLVSLLDGRAGMDLLLDSLGGAISRIKPGATAYPHRSALASAQIYAGADASTQQRVVKSVGEVRDRLTELAGQTGYLNYIDPAMPNWPNVYYGTNLARLQEVATKYDPDTVFSFAQAIPRA